MDSKLRACAVKRIFCFELPDLLRLGSTSNLTGFCIYCILEGIPYRRIFGGAHRQGRIAVGVGLAKFYGSVKDIAVLHIFRERLRRFIPCCPASITAKLHLYRTRILPNGVKLALLRVQYSVKLRPVARVCVGFPCNVSHSLCRSVKIVLCGIVAFCAPPGKYHVGGRRGNLQLIRAFQCIAILIQHVRARRVASINAFRAATAAVGEVCNALFIARDVAIAVFITLNRVRPRAGQRTLVHIVGGFSVTASFCISSMGIHVICDDPKAVFW